MGLPWQRVPGRRKLSAPCSQPPRPQRAPTPTAAQGAALSRVGGRRVDLLAKPRLNPSPSTMSDADHPRHRVGEGKTTLQSPGQFPASSSLARAATRARGGDPVSLARRSHPARLTLRELQLQLRQLRPHFGRQSRHRGRRGLQASLRHPGSASHAPEDKRGGRRRDGLTRAHTPATGSGFGRRALPAPPPPP